MPQLKIEKKEYFMGAQDSLKEILDHKYRSLKFKEINIPYLEDFVAGSQIASEYASSVRASLLSDQYGYLSSITRFNAYQELINDIDIYLSDININNYSITNIYASDIQGLIQQSQIVDLDIDIYASNIIGLITNNQINYIYASQIHGLSSTVYSSNLVGKIYSSQVNSIYASQITPYIKSSQIESMNIEITPFTAGNFGYCLNSNPCYSNSQDFQPLEGGLDVIGALEALTYCSIWAYGRNEINEHNQLSSYAYHYYGLGSQYTFTATPAQLESSCFAFLMGTTPTMAYDNFPV